MDIRQFLLGFILVIFLLVHSGICIIDEDYEDGPAVFNRCPWIRNKLKNGRVKYRYRGRVAKFVCEAGYELAGKRSATCVAGQWSNPVPVCVARGCRGSTMIANGRVTEMYRGALLGYECNPGYALEGATTIHCDGRRWNTAPPICSVATETPEMFCDFESPDLCGWSHDPNHDFDWRRNQFSTPSGHAGTGPSYDHTFGENKGGYYLYIEASTPRKLNDTARIFSPVYFPYQSGGCFLFWYHMYGATTGGLRVYLKPESHVLDELTPNWEKFGDQGSKWFRGYIDIPVIHENFQIVIEGIRGESYVGDSAIDDVSLSTNNCLSMENDTGSTEKTIADSCRGRCREEDSSSSCGCNDNCVAAHNCCRDYLTLCYEVPGNETTVANGDEPGDFYGKSTTPPTITAYFTTISNNDIKSSSMSSDASSISSTGFSVSTSSTSSTSSTASITVPSITPPTLSTTLMTTTSNSGATSPTIASSTSSKSSIYAITNPTTPVTKEKETTTPIIRITTATTSSTEKTTEITRNLTTSTTTSTSTASIPTTASSTTSVKSTTTLTSSTSSTQTESLIPITEKHLSTITEVPPHAIKTASIEIITNATTVATTQDMFTESPQTPSSSHMTTITSTRRTYNLRPRPSSTTQMSVSTEGSPTLSTVNVLSTTIKERSSILTTNSPQPRSSWHDATIIKSSTPTSSSSTITPSTIRTTQSTTYATKEYSTVKSPTISRKPTQKFSFLTSTAFPSQDRLDQQDASKSQTSASTSSVPIVVSVIAIILITIAGGMVYYMRKHRNKRQSKLSDDSEMRFLEENEYMEYSDASALDKILTK